ncbi:MAG: site-specific DNA-methyltransferase [Anaerolineales bacterium]|nr:site-specific DNA-methyltransferase [Anaerolineales bacterium]
MCSTHLSVPGTTAAAAIALGRKFVGIDISSEYCQLARERISGIQIQLLSPRSSQGAQDQHGNSRPE